MAIHSIWCPVMSAHVTRVTGFEGDVLKIICPHYEEPTGICGLKAAASLGGPLSQLLERVAEDTLDSRTARCDLASF